MDREKIRTDLLGFLRPSYPEISIRVEPWPEDKTKTAIYFVDPKFALIYPMQRYHYLSHLIPDEYEQRCLRETVWFEQAPGERPEELRYVDQELIAAITPDVMKCVRGARIFEALDDAFCPTDSAKPSSPWFYASSGLKVE